MEEVAQGRVWTGKAASSRGLVDAIGGFWRAVAIAKLKAGIALEEKVYLLPKDPNISAVSESFFTLCTFEGKTAVALSEVFYQKNWILCGRQNHFPQISSQS